jgi:glycosyltransferase involved in cell wall biosynthesis
VPFEYYPATLRYLNFDIGIAPVTDSHFNQSKSNIKWLEYSALGVPSVCSKVYPYATSIEHGVTGFLASNDDEWYRALKSLVESAELRQQIGRAAFDHVWREYAPDQCVPAWERVIAEAVTACTSSQTQTANPSR